MKERPILFSGAMVRALLDGGKTQTRRVIKTSGVADAQALGPKAACCPYGEGQHLWVRESFWGCDMPGYGDQPCVVYEDEWQIVAEPFSDVDC